MMSGYMATILVADDDPDIAELVELHLAGEGFRVFKAYDGAVKYIWQRKD